MFGNKNRNTSIAETLPITKGYGFEFPKHPYGELYFAGICEMKASQTYSSMIILATKLTFIFDTKLQLFFCIIPISCSRLMATCYFRIGRIQLKPSYARHSLQPKCRDLQAILIEIFIKGSWVAVACLHSIRRLAVALAWKCKTKADEFV